MSAENRVDKFRWLKSNSKLPALQGEWAAFVEAATDQPLHVVSTKDMEDTLRWLDMLDARVDVELDDKRQEHAEWRRSR